MEFLEGLSQIDSGFEMTVLELKKIKDGEIVDKVETGSVLEHSSSSKTITDSKIDESYRNIKDILPDIGKFYFEKLCKAMNTVNVEKLTDVILTGTDLPVEMVGIDRSAMTDPKFWIPNQMEILIGKKNSASLFDGKKDNKDKVDSSFYDKYRFVQETTVETGYVEEDDIYEDEYIDTHDLEGIVEVKNFNEDLEDNEVNMNFGEMNIENVDSYYDTKPLNQQGMKLQKSTLDNDLGASSRHRGKVRTVQGYGNNNENNSESSSSRVQIKSSGYRGRGSGNYGRGSGNYGRGSGNYGRNQENNNSDNNRSETPDSDR